MIIIKKSDVFGPKTQAILFTGLLGHFDSISTIEPSGISRSDCNRSDGATLVPWKCGHTSIHLITESHHWNQG